MSELVVECPTCQKKVEWKAENKYRPFCSERCKLIDFGEWAKREQNNLLPFLSLLIFNH